MISDTELENFRKEYRTVEYNPPFAHPQHSKSRTYLAKVIDYDNRDVHIVTEDGRQLWLFREYCSLPLKT